MRLLRLSLAINGTPPKRESVYGHQIYTSVEKSFIRSTGPLEALPDLPRGEPPKGFKHCTRKPREGFL